ncbi:hypothetical protein DPMN_160575 [Dreissena polymorpha]|uniref:Uncharacterized protein n=1 Tax=Dreissena polymorpha TaxID=45954 RepID=A0A9D4EN27_DREPO|nr:hypothetical protein DPMN_160575 [Dreissena polymorpha]
MRQDSNCIGYLEDNDNRSVLHLNVHHAWLQINRPRKIYDENTVNHGSWSLVAAAFVE